MYFASINPTTELEEACVVAATEVDVDRALALAAIGFAQWSSASLRDRVAALHRIAATLRARAEELATLAAREMGKPVAEGRAEVEKCAWTAAYVAGQAESYFGPLDAPSDAARSYVSFEPLGAILAVMPWNFPYWQVFRFGAAALLAGNVILLKHAPNVPRCAAALEALVREAGLPSGVFQNLFVPIDPPDLFEKLMASSIVQATTLTGSERAGRAVAALAGRHLKPAVLELGGSDPFLILEDANVDLVIDAAVRARTQNNGQSCIAAKRFLVADSLADRFVEGFAAALAALSIGDPLDPAVRIGPLARADLRDALERQLEASVQGGAVRVAGGTRPRDRGWFVSPALLDRCRPGMPAMDEETFGPLAAVARVRNDDEAIALANASRYGLGASVWTADPARGEKVATRLQAGSVFVNGMVKSDPRLPFGGIKCSGYGRELSVFGAREFVNVKSVWIGDV